MPSDTASSAAAGRIDSLCSVPSSATANTRPVGAAPTSGPTSMTGTWAWRTKSSLRLPRSSSPSAPRACEPTHHSWFSARASSVRRAASGGPPVSTMRQVVGAVALLASSISLGFRAGAMIGSATVTSSTPTPAHLASVLATTSAITLRGPVHRYRHPFDRSHGRLLGQPRTWNHVVAPACPLCASPQPSARAERPDLRAACRAGLRPTAPDDGDTRTTAAVEPIRCPVSRSPTSPSSSMVQNPRSACTSPPVHRRIGNSTVELEQISQKSFPTVGDAV